MTDPISLRLTKPIDDVRAWTEKTIYAPTGWVPALDETGAISPVQQRPPASTAGLPVFTNATCQPLPDWAAGNTVVNLLRFTYQRVYLPLDPMASKASDGLVALDVVVEYDDVLSMARFGEQDLELDGSAFVALCFTGDGAPADQAAEVGWGLANDRQYYVGLRYASGAPAIKCQVIQEAYPTLRVGDWVVLALSWLPDYVTGRRGVLALAQVIALGDLDCAWREATVELVPPGVS